MTHFVTPQWLGDILGKAGFHTQITNIQFESLGENPFNKKWRLHLQHATNNPDLPETLFLKWSHLSCEAQFYQIARHLKADFATVPCYFAQVEEGDNYILLSDLSDTHEARPPAQLPPLGHECDQIIDSLADLHVYWWDHPDLESTFKAIPTATEVQNEIIADGQQYQEFANFLEDRLPQWRRDIYETIILKLPAIMGARYASQRHFTLTFEDVHIGNFLYPKRTGERLYFIDWEQWNINLGMNDLAYMMAMFWSQERRDRLERPYLERYHQRIQAKGVTTYSWDDLWRDYRLCVMRHLLTILWQQANGNPTDVWWNHLERLTAAYVDLKCRELLDG